MINLSIHTEIGAALIREYGYLESTARNIWKTPTYADLIADHKNHILAKIKQGIKITEKELLPDFMEEIYYEYWEEDVEYSIISQLKTYNDAAMIEEWIP